jgi:hypothetical protein
MDFSSVLYINNDGMLELALLLMKSVITIIVIIIGQIIIIRSIIMIQDKRTEKFRSVWRSVITECIFEAPDTLPYLPRSYMRHFVIEWNLFYGSLRGDSHDHLLELAKRVHTDKFALRCLVARQPKIRILGVITLGNMRVEKAWGLLASLARTSDVVISLSSVRALLQIDSERAMNDIFDLFLTRQDWPMHNVVQLLKDVDQHLIIPRMKKQLLTTDENRQAKLLQYLDALHCRDLIPELKQLLAADPDGRIIGLCLQLIYEPEGRDLALRYIDYFRWHVRVHAASALGRVGMPEDVDTLTALLEDKEWWVRYRAACAISEMPFVTTDKLKEISRSTKDQYARDMLDHVIAERILV